MKPVFLSILMLVASMWLAACDADGVSEPLTGAAAINATAVSAQQTANAANILANGANAFANSIEGKQTAVKQVTRDFAEARATNLALQFASDNATASATRVIATEAAQRANATATATREHATLIASQRETAVQAGKEVKATKQAEADKSATWIAESPTREFIAARIQSEKKQRELDAALTSERERVQRDTARYVAMFNVAWDTLAVPCIVALVTIVILYGLVKAFGAFARFIDSHTDARRAETARQLILNDGPTPVAVIVLPSKRNGELRVDPIKEIPAEVVDNAPTAPLLARDANEAAKATPAVAEPIEPLVGDFVYPSTLRAFTQAILVDFDWTEDKWRNQVLPRGYVMSMDTRDSQGKIVYGGYSRLLQLYVDRHLIINRRPGATGDWNPNAPRDVEKVMDILENKAPLPAIQIAAPKIEPLSGVEGRASENDNPSPALSRRRARKAAMQLG